MRGVEGEDCNARGKLSLPRFPPSPSSPAVLSEDEQWVIRAATTALQKAKNQSLVAFIRDLGGVWRQPWWSQLSGECHLQLREDTGH